MFISYLITNTTAGGGVYEEAGQTDACSQQWLEMLRPYRKSPNKVIGLINVFKLATYL